VIVPKAEPAVASVEPKETMRPPRASGQFAFSWEPFDPSVTVQEEIFITRRRLTWQTIYRIKNDPAAVEAALTTWGMLQRAGATHRSARSLTLATLVAISTPRNGQWHAKSVSDARPDCLAMSTRGTGGTFASAALLLFHSSQHEGYGRAANWSPFSTS
jgi:hypothetical protein